MSDGVIEIERSGRRWAWAVAYPEPDGRLISCLKLTESVHPMASSGVYIDGRPYRRVAWGFAWSRDRAARKAGRARRRYDREVAAAKAEAATYEVIR